MQRGTLLHGRNLWACLEPNVTQRLGSVDPAPELLDAAVQPVDEAVRFRTGGEDVPARGGEDLAASRPERVLEGGDVAALGAEAGCEDRCGSGAQVKGEVRDGTADGGPDDAAVAL